MMTKKVKISLEAEILKFIIINYNNNFIIDIIWNNKFFKLKLFREPSFNQIFNFSLYILILFFISFNICNFNYIK